MLLVDIIEISIAVIKMAKISQYSTVIEKSLKCRSVLTSEKISELIIKDSYDNFLMKSHAKLIEFCISYLWKIAF